MLKNAFKTNTISRFLLYLWKFTFYYFFCLPTFIYLFIQSCINSCFMPLFVFDRLVESSSIVTCVRTPDRRVALVRQNVGL